MQDEIPVPALDEDLLRLALTHRSYFIEHPGEGGDNERLEFLGDSVVGLIVGDFLYRAHPEADEGELTRRKALLVQKKTLAYFAREIGLSSLIRLGRGEEGSGGRRRESILASSFEALVGAVFIGLGMEAAFSFMTDILRKLVPSGTASPKDSKSRLQEYFLEHFKLLPVYEVVREEGPPHQRLFTVEVRLEGKTITEGCGGSKQEAEQSAASAALESLI
ncbi:MAG: ribonuclease III [bacterium]